MDIHHLLNIGTEIIKQAILLAPGERPSIVTARHSFSWTAFTEELKKQAGSDLVISEAREALDDHLKPMINELLGIFRQDKKNRRQLRLKWEAKEIEKRRADYERLHAQALEHMREIYLKSKSEDIHKAYKQLLYSQEGKKTDSKPSRQISRKVKNKAEHISYEEMREKELKRWQNIVEPIERILRDALGDLYGSGTIAKFISGSGNIDWTVLSQVAKLPVNDVKRTAQNECKYLLMEIKDTIISHRDQIQKWLSETRLGI